MASKLYVVTERQLALSMSQEDVRERLDRLESSPCYVQCFRSKTNLAYRRVIYVPYSLYRRCRSI